MKVNKSDCSFEIIVRNGCSGGEGEGKPSGYLQVQDTSQTFRRNHETKLAVQSGFRYIEKLWVLASPKCVHLHQPR